MDRIHTYSMGVPIDGMAAQSQKLSVPVADILGEDAEIEMRVSVGDGVSTSTAEAWAVGQRGGVPVTEGDPTYQNNAKYYAEQARTHDSSAKAYAEAAQASQNQAAKDMTDAQAAAEAARGAVDDAESAAADAKAAAQEAADTVIAAQGPGILYIGEDGIPYVLDE